MPRAAGRSIASCCMPATKVIAEDINSDVERLKRPGIVPSWRMSRAGGCRRRKRLHSPSKLRQARPSREQRRPYHEQLVVDMTLDDWNAIMSVNVTGAFLHSREAMKAMIPNKAARSSTLPPTPPISPSHRSRPTPRQGRTGATDADAGARSHRTWHSRQRRRLGRCSDEYLG